MMRIIWIDGGLGRTIAFTGALEFLKEKVKIITSFPWVFKGNPWVTDIYPLHTPDLFSIIKKHNFIHPEPYEMPEYFRDHKHIISCFIKELTGKEGFHLPKIYLSEDDLFDGNAAIQQFIPFTLVQPWGQSGGKKSDPTHRSFSQKTAQTICDLSKNPILVKAQDQRGIDKAMQLNFQDPKEVIGVIMHADKIICCDSFLQHAAAALGKKAIVFWSSTLPSIFGYEMHKNIVAEKIEMVPCRIPHNLVNAEFINTGNDSFSMEKIKDALKIEPKEVLKIDPKEALK